MKNRQIKYELGRYKEKVARLQDENKKLKDQVQADYAGLVEINQAVDEIVAKAAIGYGKKVTDEGVVIGWNLELPMGPLTHKVTLKTQRKEDHLLVGVILEEEAKSDGETR